ncbi:hypothetical protein [Chitinophaga qingshengii]|uniref:Carboxypeptidase regulatory-like domain-containing protein n=1 Tax=Chitinophaga qingshengii TaxID=1569794 RepID=A0ABR7TFK6_9BACT|nr:hypothetical protein [Chitinophaga qingshengii]MBC9929135.1 hypothetical protein [Chitinophaga qingshengii]
MKKALVFSGLTTLFFVHSDLATATEKTPNPVFITADNITTTFSVRITLVDIHGAPVNGSTGLRGYWAQNVATGEYFYPGGQEDEDKFENLPAGTYTFGAYAGNWDGAVSKTVMLSSGDVGSDGYIAVALTYWVE